MVYKNKYKVMEKMYNCIEPSLWHIYTSCKPSVKKMTQQTICYIKTEKKKQNNEQPPHKTAHLQAPTHKPMLQLAKELFSCQRTSEY